VIDIRAFQIERERLRRFCLQGTQAIIVIRDLTAPALDDPARAIAEWLLLVLTVDARRFADPDDDCDDLVPSVFAVPRMPVRQRHVAVALDAHPGPAQFIIDYRIGEVMWPLIQPQRRVADTLRQTELWDRGLRQRRRIGGLVTREAAASGIAIAFDGSFVLRRLNGEMFDINSSFWQIVTREISLQRCVARGQWKRAAFDIRGNA
jgi:hypothetical protein